MLELKAAITERIIQVACYSKSTNKYHDNPDTGPRSLTVDHGHLVAEMNTDFAMNISGS